MCRRVVRGVDRGQLVPRETGRVVRPDGRRTACCGQRLSSRPVGAATGGRLRQRQSEWGNGAARGRVPLESKSRCAARPGVLRAHRRCAPPDGRLDRSRVDAARDAPSRDRGRHQRRLGDGGQRPRIDGPPWRAGRARSACRRVNSNTVVVVNAGSPVRCRGSTTCGGDADLVPRRGVGHSLTDVLSAMRSRRATPCHARGLHDTRPSSHPVRTDCRYDDASSSVRWYDARQIGHFPVRTRPGITTWEVGHPTVEGPGRRCRCRDEHGCARRIDGVQVYSLRHRRTAAAAARAASPSPRLPWRQASRRRCGPSSPIARSRCGRPRSTHGWYTGRYECSSAVVSEGDDQCRHVLVE